MYTYISSPLQNVLPTIISVENKKEVVIVVSRSNLFFSLFCLKKHINFQYKILSCISGVDYLTSKYRYSVVYDLLCLIYSNRLRVKVFVDETTPLASVVNVFPGADWWEREVWDLYGIFFNNHPDLRRILTDYGFDGHPMRKDFPLSGFIELRYDLKQKQIVFCPVELSQEFRSFSFEFPWE